MPGLGSADITNTLDNLFANNSVADFTQKFVSPAWLEIENGPSKNINAKGPFYLYKSQAPNYIRSKAFGVNPGEQFPKPSKSKYALMNLVAIQDDATIEWDGDVDVQNNKPALKERPARDLDYVKSEMRDIYEAYARDKSRQLWQNRTNEIARVSAIANGTGTVTTNNAGNLFNAQLIEAGDFLEVRDAAGTLRGYVQVDTVQRSAKTFTVLAGSYRDAAGVTAAGLTALGVANNDRLYPEGGFNNGWSGIPYLTGATGNFQGVTNRENNEMLSGESYDAGGGSLSYALIRRLMSNSRYRNNGNKTRGKFYGSTQIDAFEATGIATQYYGQGKKLDIGYEEDDLMVLGKKFVYDEYVPRNELYFVDTKAIDKFELREFKPIRYRDGYDFQKPGSGMHYDASQIHFKGIGNLGAEIPAAVGAVLTNLSTAGLAVGD